MFDLIANLQISFDWGWIDQLATQSLFSVMWYFFINGGWVLFLYSLLWGAWKVFVYSNGAKYGAKQKFVFLAIDIPKNILQTPRAVENIFSIIAGAHSPLEWAEKKFEGKYQLGFSFEIVSIDGYVQFIIMSPAGFRNLVEASVYSQYPDAEITEVEDYTKSVDHTFPSDEYDLWGADLVPVNKDYYPIRSYLEFQEEFDPEVKFKDPMAAFLEIMNKIGPGEQIWFQIIVIPADNDWMKAGTKAIGKIMGIPEKETKTILDKILDVPLASLSFASEYILGSPPKEEKSKDKFDINRLTPIQKNEVEAIARKIDRVCFNCKIRYVYVGRKEVFKKGLAVSGIMGAIKQFTSTGLNALKPGKNKTQARLLFAKYKLARLQNQMLAAYKGRNPDTTIGTYILSTEELATLWHFPYISVKAPLVRKIEAKRGSAPVGLPLDFSKPSAPVLELPVEVESSEPVVDYDNDYFEARFAIDKTKAADKARKAEILEELKEGKIAFKVNYQEDSIVSHESMMKQANITIKPEVTEPVVEIQPEETISARGAREVVDRDVEVTKYVDKLQENEDTKKIEAFNKEEPAKPVRRSSSAPPNLPLG